MRDGREQRGAGVRERAASGREAGCLANGAPASRRRAARVDGAGEGDGSAAEVKWDGRRRAVLLEREPISVRSHRRRRP